MVRTIELAVGEQYTLRLETRGSAGYQWFISQAGEADIVSVTLEPCESSAGTIGSQGPRAPSTFSPDTCVRFIAQSAGRAFVRLQHRRIWEDPALLLDEIEINVLVHG